MLHTNNRFGILPDASVKEFPWVCSYPQQYNRESDLLDKNLHDHGILYVSPQVIDSPQQSFMLLGNMLLGINFSYIKLII